MFVRSFFLEENMKNQSLHHPISAFGAAFTGESAAFAQMTNDFLYPALRKPRQFLQFAYGY